MSGAICNALWMEWNSHTFVADGPDIGSVQSLKDTLGLAQVSNT